MSRGSGIRAGRAFMEFFLNDTAVQKGLNRIQRHYRDWGRQMSRAGVVLTGVGAAIVGPLAIFAREAGQAEVVTTLLGQRFGELSDEAVEFATRYADAIEASKFTIMEALSVFQSFFLGLGFAQKESAKLSQALVEMSADLAAANPQISGLDDAIRRFVSAMSGSAEVLDRFGINLKVAAIDQELLALGINKTSSTATEQQKTIARLSASIKALTAQGTLGKAVELSTTFRNQFRGIGENLKTFRIAVGAALLKTRGFLTVINDIIKAGVKWVDNNHDFIKSFAAVGATALVVGSALTGLGITIQLLGVAIGGLATPLTILKSLLGLLVTTVTGLASIVGGPLTFLAVVIGGGIALLGDFTDVWKVLGTTSAAIGKTMVQSIGIVVAFLRRGEFDKAWKTATLGMRIIWLEAWSGMVEGVKGIWKGIESGWDQVVKRLADAMLMGVAKMTSYWEVYKNKISTIGEDTFQRWDEQRRRTQIDNLEQLGLISGGEAQKRRLDLQRAIEEEWQAQYAAEKGRLNELSDEIVAIGKRYDDIIENIWDGETPSDFQLPDWNADAIAGDIGKLRRELRALQKEAEENDVLDPYVTIADGLLDTIKEMAATLKGSVDNLETSSVFGSFSSQALSGMRFGSGSAQERTAKAAEETATNTKKTEENTLLIFDALDDVLSYQ